MGLIVVADNAANYAQRTNENRFGLIEDAENADYYGQIEEFAVSDLNYIADNVMN